MNHACRAWTSCFFELFLTLEKKNRLQCLPFRNVTSARQKGLFFLKSSDYQWFLGDILSLYC